MAHTRLLTVSLLCSGIRNIVEGKPSKLIETVAENIATDILDNHNMVLGVRVSVRKPNVAIKGSFASLGEGHPGNIRNTVSADGIISAASH